MSTIIVNYAVNEGIRSVKLEHKTKTIEIEADLQNEEGVNFEVKQQIAELEGVPINHIKVLGLMNL